MAIDVSYAQSQYYFRTMRLNSFQKVSSYMVSGSNDVE